ncbi:MAG: D-aminoacyl-tRNA deacylase, partial [Gemmatimonadetes bacterium]|nr:D-aminoacyl-tRNA deacylase [Gemmatimonadota bacterium]
MRVLLQRVSSGSVTIAGSVAGSIETGFVLLVGFAPTDTAAEVEWMADKVVGLRLFPDDEGKMNRDLAEAGGGL